MSNRDTCLCGQMFALHNEKFCITASKINEDSVSKFPTIENLGLDITANSWGIEMVRAKDLESLLQSAQVVYGVWDKNGCRFAESQFPGHTHTAMLLNITPIKKKTKAEAALELLEKIYNGLDNGLDIKPDDYCFKIKHILEMKD